MLTDMLLILWFRQQAKERQGAVSDAQNSKETARIERLKKFSWKKGQSGNPGGRPKRDYAAEWLLHDEVDFPIICEMALDSTAHTSGKESRLLACQKPSHP